MVTISNRRAQLHFDVTIMSKFSFAEMRPLELHPMQEPTAREGALPEPSHGLQRALLEQFGEVPADEYPPNKIAKQCNICLVTIPRYRGYHHVDQKRLLCRRCQADLGYPVRDVDDGADP